MMVWDHVESERFKISIDSHSMYTYDRQTSRMLTRSLVEDSNCLSIYTTRSALSYETDKLTQVEDLLHTWYTWYANFCL